MIPVDGGLLQTRHLSVGPAHLDGIHLISGPQPKVQLVGMLRAVGISRDNWALVFAASKFHRYARTHRGIAPTMLMQVYTNPVVAGV